MNWKERFNNQPIKLLELIEDGVWKDLISSYKWLSHLQNSLEHVVTPDTFPLADDVFKCFNLTPFEKVKVVIIGQDPYCGTLKSGYPQANGLAFACNGDVTPTLLNIYKNLQKYGHIDHIPSEGCLDGWAKQGVLLLNASLTVISKKPNSHKNIWSKFTDRIIRKISKRLDPVVFVLWGNDAISKMSLIDQRHPCVRATHPSPYSANMNRSDAFMNVDTFKQVNDYLLKVGKEPVIWSNFS